MTYSAELPWEEAQDPLIDVLAELVAEEGAERLLRGPLVEPTAEAFPDSWEPSFPAVGQLLHRLLCYAGLGTLDFELLDGRPVGLTVPVVAPMLHFLGLRGSTLRVEVEALGAPDMVAARLCSLVGRALVARRAKAHSDEDRRIEKAAVAVTFLGLALLPLQGMRGGDILRHLQGDLPTGELTFLLAVWLTVRDQRDRRTLKAHLSDELAQEVGDWLDALAPHSDLLLRRLAIPPLSSTSPLPLPVVPALPPARQAALDEAERRHRYPGTGRTVARKMERSFGSFAVLGLLIGFVAGAVVLSTGAPLAASACLVGGPIVVGLLGGLRRSYICGGCQRSLGAADRICPHCGATLAPSS